MSSKQPQSLTLSDDDRLRLENLAPAFDIQISQVADGSYRLHSLNERAPLETTLSAEIAHARLLVEICSRAVHWIHFHFGKSCKDSLLELNNARILRIAELYSLRRDAIRANESALTGVGIESPSV